MHIEAERDIHIDQAKAMGSALTGAHIRMYGGDGGTVDNIRQLFTSGFGIGEALEGVAQSLPEGLRERLARDGIRGIFRRPDEIPLSAHVGRLSDLVESTLGDDAKDMRFADALSRIRRMTTQPPSEFIPAVSELCANAGVAFCMVRELPKSGANGATRWLTDRKAMIQMSNRNKWADIFWFTFFHEACHLLKHRTRRRIVIDGLGADPEVAEIEAEADRFARDFLIDPRAWNDFCREGRFTANSVRKFARSTDVAPFVVVGRLQKERRIAFSRLTRLKPRYEWADASAP